MAKLEQLIEDADEHYRQARLDAALATYDKVLKQEPDHLEALEWRGELAVQQDDYERAVETLSRARQLRGDDAFTEYTNLGLCYYELNMPEEAVETLWRAVRRRPRARASARTRPPGRRPPPGRPRSRAPSSPSPARPSAWAQGYRPLRARHVTAG